MRVVALMHVYVLEHIESESSRTAHWILMKHGSEVLMFPYMLLLLFFGEITQMWIQSGAKICHRGPFLKNLLQNV